MVSEVRWILLVNSLQFATRAGLNRNFEVEQQGELDRF